MCLTQKAYFLIYPEYQQVFHIGLLVYHMNIHHFYILDIFLDAL